MLQASRSGLVSYSDREMKENAVSCLRAVWRLLPWALRRRYWKQAQCPAERPCGRGWRRCMRRRHESPWHKDSAGVQWRDSDNAESL
jgi:hypothetical protein